MPLCLQNALYMFPFINPSLPFTEYLHLFLNFYEVSGNFTFVCSACFNEGYGHMIHQLQCLETQPYIVALKFCHLTGNVNQTAWYVN